MARPPSTSDQNDPTASGGNWVQTVPGKGWFQILRFDFPKQLFFDKTWRAGEVEEVG